MRILIDLQGAQGPNAFRGIGRYARFLTGAMIDAAGGDEVHVLLNGDLVETAIALRSLLAGSLPSDRIHCFFPVRGSGSAREREWHALASIAVRRSAIAEIEPDVVVIASLFEGFNDPCVVDLDPIPGVATAVVLYDLIPLLFPDSYLTDPAFGSWYLSVVSRLQKADLLLCISSSTRDDAISYLRVPPSSAVDIGGAPDPGLDARAKVSGIDREVVTRLGLRGDYVMYTGGIDHRKNIERLLSAFATLPGALRFTHQLAIVCNIDAASRDRLEANVLQLGLRSDDVIFTGYVDDFVLDELYRNCKLFVFPSWYEGLGLPVLEAMTFGRAVIGARSSSVTELIGRDDALFDPHDTAALADLLERALHDAVFRKDLEDWAQDRVHHYSWRRTAELALESVRGIARSNRAPEGERLRLAYLSPLPPTASGISDYSALLIPELERHYDVVAIVPDDHPEAVGVNCRVRSLRWFKSHHRSFDRVLYHFGNSEFHIHMFDLLNDVPGVVVLHDFFLSGVLAHADGTGDLPGVLRRSMFESHGYSALLELKHQPGSAEPIWKYPASLRVLQSADGVIVHSSHSRRLAAEWFGPHEGAVIAEIPLLRARLEVDESARAAARRDLGFGVDEFVVATFGLAGPTKLTDRVIRGFSLAGLVDEPATRLVVAGGTVPGEFGGLVTDTLASIGQPGRFYCSGQLSPDDYRRMLLAADVAVQLRSLGRGETSAAILDAMNAGLPVVANAHGSAAELPSDAVLLLPDDFTDDQLAGALRALFLDPERRKALGDAGRAEILRRHLPSVCADQYRDAIERFAAPWRSRTGLVGSLGPTLKHMPRDASAEALAVALSRSIPVRPRQRQLLVDVSELAQRDARSGIQRVTRNILLGLLRDPPPGVRVEPVYAAVGSGYRYARRFAEELLGLDPPFLTDDRVDVGRGDMFLGLDLQPFVVVDRREEFRQMRAAGVEVRFVLYDLLPMLIPEAFLLDAAEHFGRWLEVVLESDGALCISESVASELRAWLADRRPDLLATFSISAFPLGSDIEPSGARTPVPQQAFSMLIASSDRPTFLMVGTLEPRKSHAQVLDAFDLLWATGVDVNLVIIGKQGWMVDDLAERLATHSEAGRRLHWLVGADDDLLRLSFEVADCAIAASIGEGFGLPLVEASSQGVPLLIRDIPVFREVAGEHAEYFSGTAPADVAFAVRRWLDSSRMGRTTTSSGVRRMTWADSASRLKQLLFGRDTTAARGPDAEPVEAGFDR